MSDQETIKIHLKSNKIFQLVSKRAMRALEPPSILFSRTLSP